MKLRLPLYSRILLWFLLNIVVLAGAFLLVVRLQFGQGLSTALGTLVTDRISNIAEQMHNAFSSSGPDQWDRLLRSFEKKHNVQAALVQGPGIHLAGSPLQLPEDIIHEAERMFPGRRGPGGPLGPGPGGGGPPRRPPPPGASLFGDDFFAALTEDGPPDPPGDEPGMMPQRLGMFMKSTQTSPRHWVGVIMPPPRLRMREDGPIILYLASDSLTGHGLFFDVRPWVYGLLGALLVSALLWLPFVHGITHSVRLTMKATEQIAQGRFDVRVPETRSDELGRMAQAVNQMAERLDGYVRGQKRFLGDIAHELCSPIARMEVGLSILENQVPEPQQPRLADVSTELRDISAMVHELLSFSKSSSSIATQPLTPIALRPLIEACARTEGHDSLSIEVPETLQALARPDAIKRAISNLLRNAKLHAPGPITISTALTSEGHIALTLADEGPGVPADSLPRLFDPFYRVDTARARETGGTGLGLAIVKTCVEACQGQVTAKNRSPHGLAVTITLAAAAG
jgi:two-component system, OmpR family, sensor histidine kinase CpxA